MDVDRLQSVLSEHKTWWMGDGGKRAYLQGADLRRADLQGADLRRADLRGADLRGADLQGASLTWESHDLIAEILRCAAGNNVERRMVAGLVLVSRDWCWQDFAKLQHPESQWAIQTLAAYVQPDDRAPTVVREAVTT